MFLRRIFARKDSNDNGAEAAYDNRNNEDRNEDIHRREGLEELRDCDRAANNNNSSSSGRNKNDYELQRLRKHDANTAPTNSDINAEERTKLSGAASNLHRANSSAAPAATAMQLTPLWEHILRTHSLPPDIYPLKMFDEFHERLRDPEWQVRQHALRVFVDVLVVMRAEADTYMDPLIPPLVENLGNQAPTVRKGALDCLRVYLAETAMAETILLQILDIGLNQRITNEPFGGRLTCGVMLSLPALVQSTLHSSKRHYILRTAIGMLVQKMGQVTHQEITLKVLSKLRELVGETEFRQYMSKGAYREFDLLCSVYSMDSKASGSGHGSAHARHAGYGSSSANTWRMLSKQSVPSCWRSSDEEQMLDEASRGKVIMETEIKINDDTLTMRILEAKDDDFEKANENACTRKREDKCSSKLEDGMACGRSHDSSHEISAVVRLLSDSEETEDKEEQTEEMAMDNGQPRNSHKFEAEEYFTIVTPSTPSRTPKRVTFGGEVVKMRTPDSDANSGNNTSNNGAALSLDRHLPSTTPVEDQNTIYAGGGMDGEVFRRTLGTTPSSESVQHTITTTTTTTEIKIISTPSTSATNSPLPEDSVSKTMALSVEIFNDNTKPLPEALESSASSARPRTAQSARRSQTPNTLPLGAEDSSSPLTSSANSVSSQSPPKRHESTAISPGTNSTVSPHMHFKRLSISPVDNIVSPKVPHKPIEVMHNLQRDPSPVRARSARRASSARESTEGAVDGKAESGGLLVTHATQTPRAHTPSPPPPKTWEELDIVNYDTILDLRSGNWHHRLQGITQLEEALRSSDKLAQVQPCLDSLLRTLLSSERHPDVAEAKTQLMINLVTRLPLDNLEDRTTQIMNGLCRQGGAGANRVCKALMHRLPAASIVLKLLSQEFLHAKSSRFREHALQMVMYALMTFPSTCFDTKTCATQATYAALNRKRRVRQAALDVLAILGHITGIRTVVDVVQGIVSERDEGPALISAVRTRLARKQMPLLSADGEVQYSLRLPSTTHSNTELAEAESSQRGADIEWIAAGVGSVSPSSLRRRVSRRSFRCLPPQNPSDVEGRAMGTPCRNFHICDGEGAHRHAFKSPPDVYGKFKESSGSSNNDLHSHNIQHIIGSNLPLHYGQTSKKSTNADYGNYLSRRLVAKSCSDSSMDGRSSDSTYTSSSGGGGSGSGGGGGDRSAASNDSQGGSGGKNDSCTGISGRFTRQAGNSRFPAMDRMDMNSRIYKPIVYHPGMGAYAHLKQQQINMGSTYPKINSNYGLTPQQQQQQHKHQMQQQQRKRPHHQQQKQQQQQHHQRQTGQPSVVIGTRALRTERGDVAFVPENFRSAENSPMEHNKNNNNSDMDGNNTIYTSRDNKAVASAIPPNNRSNEQQQKQTETNSSGRFVNAEEFVQNDYRRSRKSIRVATAGDQITEVDGVRIVSTSGDTCEMVDRIVTAKVKNNNNVSFDDWKQAPQLLEYTEQSGIPQLFCNGSSGGGDHPNINGEQQSPPVLAMPSIPNGNFCNNKTDAANEEAATVNEATDMQEAARITESKQTTPLSIKSATYSQKSTASAQSAPNGNGHAFGTPKEAQVCRNSSQNPYGDSKDSTDSSPAIQMITLPDPSSDTEVNSPIPTKWRHNAGDLQLEDVQDIGISKDGTTSLSKIGSLASLHSSKSESIKTQLGNSPPVLSRAQSTKSLLIEEDIVEDSGSFFATDELHMNRRLKSASGSKEDIIPPSEGDPYRNGGKTPVKIISATHTPARSHSPTIAEIKALSRRNSMIKSMESLYERPPSPTKPEPMYDNASTESGGSATSSQLNTVIPIKPQHTPLKQKAKTSHFLKSHRRVSPVKQAINKMPPAELYPPTLQRFEKPRDVILKTFDQLDSSSWEMVMLGLKSMVRLVRYHAEYLENQMHMVCIQLTRSVRNLRSQVARASCQASTELFTLKSKGLEQECDDLVCALLHRTADTNRFLRADATRALESMCDNLTPTKVLNILTTKGAQHQHALVRTMTAKLLHRLVERLGPDKVYTLQREHRDKFFVTGANLLLEGSLETRSYAKSLFRLLSDHPTYQRLLLEVIPQRTYRNVEKTLKSIR